MEGKIGDYFGKRRLVTGLFLTNYRTSWLFKLCFYNPNKIKTWKNSAISVLIRVYSPMKKEAKQVQRPGWIHVMS